MEDGRSYRRDASKRIDIRTNDVPLVNQHFMESGKRKGTLEDQKSYIVNIERF